MWSKASTLMLDWLVDDGEIGVRVPAGSTEGRVENHLGNITLRTADWDLNPDIPVIGSLVYFKSDALDHSTTEAESNVYMGKGVKKALELLAGGLRRRLAIYWTVGSWKLEDRISADAMWGDWGRRGKQYRAEQQCLETFLAVVCIATLRSLFGSNTGLTRAYYSSGNTGLTRAYYSSGNTGLTRAYYPSDSNGSVAVSLPPPADPSNPRDGVKSAWYSRANHDERMRRVVDRARRGCTKKLLYKRIPVLTWLPQYNLSVAASDLVAGFTVGLTVIPQAIAYANVAGLPPQYGLYSSFMACFVYTIFGSCKDSPVGPTAIAAILTRENLHGLGPEFAVLMCFLCGCVVMLMGILQLGFLIDFISGPVSVGFTSAAAIIIATTQIKDLLGLSFPGSKFLDVWEQLFEHISETRLWDTLLGFACMAILLLLRKAKDIPVGPADTNKRTTLQKVLGQMLWLISTGRNILVVVVCAVMAYTFKLHDVEPFLLTGYVKPGLPPFQPPPFMATVGNTTYSFLDMTSSLGSALFVVPLLAILEDVALAKVFSDGRAIDATQEMLAIGACNILSSFVSSMPVSGALSRGAVNHASGVATTFGGIYTGILVILSLYLFTPYFAYIPKASLAAVIVAAVVFMVEFHVVKPMWRTKITYTTETWTLNVREIRKVEAMRMKFMRRMLTVTRRNRIRNEVILEIVIWTSNEYVKGENTKENIEVEVWREKTANETREEMGGADNNKFVKLDLIPAIATFLSCLFIRLELGIVIGIGINILFLLYASARPSVHVEKVTSSSGCEYLLITPDRSLVFPSVEYVRNLVTKAGMKEGSSCTPVVIDSRHIQGADFTAAKVSLGQRVVASRYTYRWLISISSWGPRNR
uniref:SLC26A/SulP transporter domain-containing protein n=1 Tax=Timema tahoe TaxID=61484 RepID=A0A7R9NZX3_9NEOP|nr:unnamed protein product [Timema tahoe]